MGRMYSGKKGKAGSKRPSTQKPQPWLSYKPNEVEQLVVKLSKSGKIMPQIGIILRDSYGIPDVQKLTNKKIIKILKEHKIESKIPEELSNLIKKEINIMKHLEKNKFDMPSRRGLMLTESKIKKLTKYYIKKRVLPENWKYSKEQIKITI